MRALKFDRKNPIVGDVVDKANDGLQAIDDVVVNNLHGFQTVDLPIS